MAFTGPLDQLGCHAWPICKFLRMTCLSALHQKIGKSLASSYHHSDWVLGGGWPVILFHDRDDTVKAEEMTYGAPRSLPWGQPIPPCKTCGALVIITAATGAGKVKTSAKYHCLACGKKDKHEKPENVASAGEKNNFWIAPFDTRF